MNTIFSFLVIISLYLGVQCAVTGGISTHDNDNSLHAEVKTCGLSRVPDKSGRPDYSPSNFGEIPWKAVILNSTNDKVFCTGSIINEWFILTAASCFNKLSGEPTEIKVRLNEYNLKENPDCADNLPPGIFPCSEEKFTATLGVKSVHLHPQFNKDNLLNDIAVLKTSTKIEFSLNDLYPVCLPSPNVTVATDMTLVDLYGWGISPKKDPNFEVLQRTYANILSKEECQKSFGTNRTIYDNQICTRPTDPKMPKCIEDNGGSLEQISTIGVTQIGVASLGKEGCNLYFPTVYTNVTHYSTWILEIIQ